MKTSPWMILTALCVAGGCATESSEDTDTDTGSESSSTDPATGPTTDPTTGPSGSSTTEDGTTGSTSVADTGSSSGSETGTDTGEGSSSTGEATREITLNFAGRINGVDAACDTDFAGLGSAGSDAQVRDFRLYVSNIRLIDGEGNEVPLDLEQDGVWQFEDVALLDYEDGTGLCADTGNPDLRSTVVGTVPEGDYDGIRFDIGVPGELNHTDPNTAEPPLNLLPMTWNWLAGRKFVRFDFDVDTGEVDKDENPIIFGWNTHLGSQGCMNDGPNPMEPPAMDCTRPQRPAIAFDTFDPDTNTIVVDAGTLLGDVDVSSNVQGAPGCMSFFPPDPMMQDDDCADVFPNYGMDWQTGDCVDGCVGQTFITVE